MRPFVIALATLLLVTSGFGQRPSLKEEKFHGRDAYVLENPKMRVAALRGAGHIAEIRLKSSDPQKNVNPMRVPHYPTIEPWEYDPAKHDTLYGGAVNRILMSGYMGHLLNFPTFGNPSESEAEAGLGAHGEALAVEWKKERADSNREGVSLWYSAHLPKTQYNVGRKLTLPATETVLYIEEWVENLTAFDRPIHWVEHVTFGPPFVEPGKTVLDVSATKGEVRRDGGPGDTLQSGPVVWPRGTSLEGQPVSLRAMQTKPHAGTYYALLMDPQKEMAYFTMYHQDYRVLIGYIWRTADYPWIGDWQENRSNEPAPWERQVVARGMEFGTTPFGGPMEQVVEEGSLYGVPLYRWIGSRQRLTTRYVAFLAEIPEGFHGVEDLQLADGQITITERETGSVLTLPSAAEW